MRQAVLRDLAWLFNATRLRDGGGHGGAALRPTLGDQFRAAALSGQTASTLDVTAMLERGIRQAILDFEPRILPTTLEVRALIEPGELDHHNVIGIEIHGQLWAQPVPIELLVRTEIDLETGKVQIADLAPARAG